MYVPRGTVLATQLSIPKIPAKNSILWLEGLDNTDGPDPRTSLYRFDFIAMLLLARVYMETVYHVGGAVKLRWALFATPSSPIPI